MTRLFKKNLVENISIRLGSWMSLGDSGIAELMSNAGFEWLTIDMEHSSITLREAESMIRVIENSGSTPLVRLPSHDKNLIKRIMDLGAHGIIAPMVNSAEQAREVVSGVYYPPVGTRGVGLSRAQKYGSGFQDYKNNLSDLAVVIAQIEHIDGVKNLDEILKVEGIDAIIVGPYDLTASMGISGEFNHPDYLSCLCRIKETAIKHNKAVGMHVVEPDFDEVRKRHEEGFNLIAYSVDFRMLDVACRNVVNEFKRD